MQLIAVAPDRRKIRGDRTFDFDAAAVQAIGEKLQHALDQSRDFERLRNSLPLPCDRKEAADDARAPLGSQTIFAGRFVACNSSSSISAWPTTIDKGLFSSWATPASREPKAAIHRQRRRCRRDRRGHHAGAEWDQRSCRPPSSRRHLWPPSARRIPRSLAGHPYCCAKSAKRRGSWFAPTLRWCRRTNIPRGDTCAAAQAPPGSIGRRFQQSGSSIAATAASRRENRRRARRSSASPGARRPMRCGRVRPNPRRPRECVPRMKTVRIHGGFLGQSLSEGFALHHIHPRIAVNVAAAAARCPRAVKISRRLRHAASSASQSG